MTTPNIIGGYDYQFVDKPLDILMCKICHLPSRDPQLSMCCGHIFCKSCLDNAKEATVIYPFSHCPMCRCTSEEFATVPNKQINREVRSLQIYCTNKEKGCKWQGEIHNICQHLKHNDGCRFETVKCFNACGAMMQRKYLTIHIETNCPQHIIKCQYCKIEHRRSFITEKHVKECPRFPLFCPNGCGVNNIPREDICIHRETCPCENIECHKGCGEEMQRKYLMNHVKTECPRRQVACQYCHRLFEHCFLGFHLDQCNKFPLPCPNNCGTNDIPRENVSEHRKECPLEIVWCTNECREDMERQNLNDHLQNTCPRRLISCQYCNTKEEHQLMDDHLKRCDKFPLTCPNECDIGTVCRSDMDEHRKVCPLETIDCEYYKVGCDMKMLRKDLERHGEENMKQHLFLTTKKLNETEMQLKERVQMLEVAVQHIINSTTMQSDELALWPSHLQLASSLIANTSGEHVMPVIVKLSNYTQIKIEEKKWHSPPFYTHKKGYKMCLFVYPNGLSNGEGTHMSVYLHIMKGPYDDQLPWPLEGKFKIQLLNQFNTTDHHPKGSYLPFDAKINVCQVTCMDTGRGRGYKTFIANEKLLSCGFLKDDSVFFEVQHVPD